MKAAVVGGGISGLACALRLQTLAKQKKIPLKISVYEAAPRLGGVIETLRKDGMILEAGPDSVSAEEPWVTEYFEDLGLGDEILRTNTNHRQSYIYIGKEFVPMSEGLKLMALSEILPFLWNARSPEDFKGVHYDCMLSFRGGMESLILKMAQKMPPESIRLNRKIEGIEAEPKGFRIDGDLGVDALCLALPAIHSGPLVESMSPALGSVLSKIPARRCATVNLVYKTQSLGRAPEGFGFVIPELENRKITGATFAGVKFPGRAKPGESIVRVFLSEKSFPEIERASPDEILGVARREIEEILQIKSDPSFNWVKIFLDSLPDARAASPGLAQAVETECAKVPGLAVAGNSFQGAGIPACIQSGQKAADGLILFMTTL